mmetsp:Transcript_86676/g.240351  ORF Transcript_86676/g.240351 Transcript_86676/m.240351 type:complete len:243 (-) Transcript_86676:543-1271(-)
MLEALAQLSRREPSVDVTPRGIHPWVEVAHEEDAVVVLMDAGSSLHLFDRRVNQYARETLGALLHLARMRRKMSIDKQDRRAAEAETNLCASLVPNKISEACGHLCRLDVPAILPEVTVEKDHHMNRTHVVGANHEVVLAEVTADLLLPPGLAAPNHRLLDGPLALASADDINVVPGPSRHPRGEVGRGLFAMEVPDTAENAHNLSRLRLNLRQLGLRPVVPRFTSIRSFRWSCLPVVGGMR